MRLCPAIYKSRSAALLASWLWVAGALPLPSTAHASKRPEGHLVDRIVAIVEDDIITAFELEQKAVGHIEELPQATGSKAWRVARRSVLERVLDEEIGERLLTKEWKLNKDRLSVTDKDIDRAIDEVVSVNHINHQQLESALIGQHMTMLEYRDKMRQQIERARLLQFKVQGKVHVKESDARRLCLERERLGEADLQVCAGHLLLSMPTDASPATRRALHKKADGLRNRLVGGESLAKLARTYSDDAASPDGSLGCFFRGEMVEAFEKAAFALQDGQVSEVVETHFGLHIIKVFERRARSSKGCESPEELQPFHAELMQQEMSRQMRIWLEELRRKSFVDSRL